MPQAQVHLSSIIYKFQIYNLKLGLRPSNAASAVKMFSLFFRAKRVFLRWSADFQPGGLAIKARCKLAYERDLRDYTQGRVGRPPRFRLTKKSSSIIYHLSSINFKSKIYNLQLGVAVKGSSIIYYLFIYLVLVIRWLFVGYSFDIR